jgi:hypothetical protein
MLEAAEYITDRIPDDDRLLKKFRTLYPSFEVPVKPTTTLAYSKVASQYLQSVSLQEVGDEDQSLKKEEEDDQDSFETGL